MKGFKQIHLKGELEEIMEIEDAKKESSLTWVEVVQRGLGLTGEKSEEEA